MIKGIEGIMIGSPNATKLAKFYKEKVGLKIAMEFEFGEDKAAGFMFETKQGSGFAMMDHSKVKGKNTTPGRYIINFEVDNIEKEVKRLEKEGVKKITDIYHVENYGKIATFEDPDGNYFQLVKTRE